MLRTLTRPQIRALVALVLLGKSSKRAGFSRWEIRSFSDHTVLSFPTKTMRAIQRAGFARPVCDRALELVESGTCRCGCDLWRATVEGVVFVATLKVKVPVRRERQDRTFTVSGREWWKDESKSPDFDLNSDTQRDTEADDTEN